LYHFFKSARAIPIPAFGNGNLYQIISRFISGYF
jgi:hypothetical protein